jgi:hypothetical protein
LTRRRERIDRRLVEIVGDEHLLLARKIPEEGAGRDLGRVGDLLDGRVGVAVPADQRHRGAADGVAGLDLLAIPQSESVSDVPHAAIVSGHDQ